jgi:hypothetical protein
LVGFNHEKTEKWLEKISPRRQHHLHLNGAIRKPKYPCRSYRKVIDVLDATTTFIGAAMEKSKPPCLSTIDEERKKSHVPQNATWRNPNPNLDSTNGRLLREMDPNSLRP